MADKMVSVTLMLIFDDIDLGIGLARIARLSFRIGEFAMARQFLSDAEECCARAERFAANLSAEDRRSATLSLYTLRFAIEIYNHSGEMDISYTNLDGLVIG